MYFFFFSSRRRHTRFDCDWSSDVCSSDLAPNYRDASRKRVIESIEKSLKNLGTDFVDVYLIHWPDRNTPFDETMQALDDLVKQGKARAVGLSNFRLEEIKACMSARRVDVVQYCWN